MRRKGEINIRYEYIKNEVEQQKLDEVFDWIFSKIPNYYTTVSGTRS